MSRGTISVMVSLVIVAAACSDSTTPRLDERTLEELLSAPDELELETQHLLLASDLILDRMPHPPPFSGFQGEVRVWEKDGKPLPDLELSRVWVILGEDIWEGESPSLLEPEGNFELRWRLESDRAWGNVMVQIVVELSRDHETHLLRAANQWITEAV